MRRIGTEEALQLYDTDKYNAVKMKTDLLQAKYERTVGQQQEESGRQEAKIRELKTKTSHLEGRMADKKGQWERAKRISERAKAEAEAIDEQDYVLAESAGEVVEVKVGSASIQQSQNLADVESQWSQNGRSWLDLS